MDTVLSSLAIYIPSLTYTIFLTVTFLSVISNKTLIFLKSTLDHSNTYCNVSTLATFTTADMSSYPENVNFDNRITLSYWIVDYC